MTRAKRAGTIRPMQTPVPLDPGDSPAPDAPPAARLFVLGLGAQKAGTTWLHDWLRRTPGFRPGPLGLKEMHVWDRIDLPALAGQSVGAGPRAVPLLETMVADPACYFRHHAWLLAEGGIAADITPAYAGLGAERLAAIAAGFARHGIALRVVFLMRDPVARCASAYVMAQPDGDEAGFADFYQGPGCRMRTDYPATLAAMQALPPGAAHVALYEQAFTPAGHAALARALGLPADPAFLARRRNPTRAPLALSAASRAACARHYRGVYAHVAQAFPQARALWGGYRDLA